MAHELYTNESGKVSMAYKGQTPWHGLGQSMVENQSIEEWTQAAGMDFDILSSPVQYQADQQMFTFPKQKVLHRSDTFAPLAVVSSAFKVVQPKEVMEFYRDLTEQSGFTMETAGVLFGGKKFWALAKIGQQSKFLDDELKGYLMLATANDGTFATTAAFTSIRVVCNNTLGFAMTEIDNGESKNNVKVSHRSMFDANAVKSQLGIASASWDNFMKNVDVWCSTSVSESQSKDFFKKLTATKGSDGKLVTSENTVEKLLDLYNGGGKGSTMSTTKDTAWGLINAVTEYVDHHKGRAADTRMNSAFFGTGATLKNKAVELVAELV